MPRPIRKTARSGTEKDDEKLSFYKEYKDKTYLFLIIPYPFMSTNPDAKYN
jgi:hypothetical protein